MLLGLCGVAGVGIVSALVILGRGDGGRTAAFPTTGPYAPIKAPPQPVAVVGGVLIGDLESSGMGGDLQIAVSPLPGPRRYQLTVTNTSSIGSVKAFQWFPSPGVRIVRVVGSTAGHCKLSGTSGLGGNQFKTVVLYPNITCDNVNLKPPSCTCRGDGGSAEISFIATQNAGLYPGSTRVMSMTPVLKIIPSYVQPEDVPVCAPNQVSMASRPCSSG